MSLMTVAALAYALLGPPVLIFWGYGRHALTPDWKLWRMGIDPASVVRDPVRAVR